MKLNINYFLGLDKVLFFLIERHNQYSKEEIAKKYNYILSFINDKISLDSQCNNINFNINNANFKDCISLKHKIDQICKKYIFELNNISLLYIKNVLNESKLKINFVKEIEIPKQLYNAININSNILYGSELFECEENRIRVFSSPEEEKYLQFSITPWESSVKDLMKKFDVPEKYL